MGLSKYRLGDLIEQVTETNSNLQFGVNDVVGMTITKEIIPTKANLTGTDLSHFLVVEPHDFVFNPRTHGKKIGFGYNDSDNSYIVSWNNIAFRIKELAKAVVLSDYLFLNFRRDEWDRAACYQSWGTSTEVFTWEALCDMEITIPAFSTQRKYVAVYKAMVANQQSYERGLEDLKLVCDGYVEDLRRRMPCEKIGGFIEPSEETNIVLQYGVDDVRGVSIEKKFIETKADMEGVSLKPYLLIRPNEFAYVTVTSRNGGKISLALNDSENTFICSSSYTVFRSKNEKTLLPQYLMLFFSRTEFDRYARFNSWGSARETFDWETMCDVQIPIPDIKIQEAIAELYTVYNTRKKINEQLKAQIKDICPILIRGSLKEGTV